jgi:hypothetical protein
VGVQFADLPLDGGVHGVERLRKLPDFVVAPPDVDFVDIQVAVVDLLDVRNELVHRSAEDEEQPNGREEQRDDGCCENDDA